MARLNRDGNTIRRVLEYMLRRDLTNAELASILGISQASFSRAKDNESFPTFEQLGKFADHYGLSAAVLRYDFGYLTGGELADLREYLTAAEPEDGSDPKVTMAPPTTSPRRLRARTDIPPL